MSLALKVAIIWAISAPVVWLIVAVLDERRIPDAIRFAGPVRFCGWWWLRLKQRPDEEHGWRVLGPAPLATALERVRERVPAISAFGPAKKGPRDARTPRGAASPAHRVERGDDDADLWIDR